LLYVIYIGLIVLGLFAERSKLYCVSVVVFMTVLAFLNTSSADYASYWSYYNQASFFTSQSSIFTEPGWLVICSVGRAIGLSYNGFAAIVTLATMSVLVLVCRRMSTSTPFFLSLFLIYPGLMSLVQFRQFVAAAIALLAFLQLVRASNHRYLKFALLVLLAASMQSTAILLLGYLIVPLYQKTPSKLRVLLAAALIAFGCLCYSHIGTLAYLLFGSTKTDAYLSGLNGSLRNGTACAFLVIVMCALSIGCERVLKRQPAGEGSAFDRESASAFATLGKYMSILMLAIIPLLYYTPDFMRLERYIFSFSLCVFALMPLLPQRHPVLSCKATYVLIALCFNLLLINIGTFDTVTAALLSPTSIPGFFS
jgi:hypothetical protein